MSNITRRDFIKAGSLAGVGAALSPAFAQSSLHAGPLSPDFRPIVISSANGIHATAKAMSMIKEGADALDAVVAGVNLVENDPDDMSVGYGGLPNEDGVVELDASCMHGPTGRGGAVGALRNIKNPSKVAKLVLERTAHVLLVGDGALRFAKAHGFVEEELLTDKSRAAWLRWKENMSTKDDWLPPDNATRGDMGAVPGKEHRPTGTINCNAIDMRGGISGVTTTSGLAYKIPGRVGDSPILGAGLYVDNEIGAAGSTGLGEANLVTCASVMVVEYMGQGKSPQEACLMACQRIQRMTKIKRLLDDKGRPNFDVNFYAINKKGEYGGASIWSGGTFSVNTGEEKSRIEESAYLYKRERG